MSLFHKEVFWPKDKLKHLENKELVLRFSHHALEACITDRYGTIRPPKSIVFHEKDAFEMELLNGSVHKVAIRIPYNKDLDVTLVLMPDGCYDSFVKTLWFNQNTDNHKTLDRTLYAQKLA